MLDIGILGATGYTGQELVKLLIQHPHVNIKYLGSQSYSGKKYCDLFPYFHNSFFRKLGYCVDLNVEQMTAECDLVFSALPHGHLGPLATQKMLKNCKLIDLSADFRLKDSRIYEEWYNTAPPDPSLLGQATYGLSELYHTSIAGSSIIANPGCYTTCSILALAPLVKYRIIDLDSIIIDAKSGVSGAGRKLSQALHFCEANETMKAYGIASHRHTPEIEQELSLLAEKPVTLTFTPHLVPMNRGILVTAYASIDKAKLNTREIDPSQCIMDLYHQFYAHSHFIRILAKGVLPETRWVKYSNFCDINCTIDTRTNRVIVIAAIDNLLKGAAGQAIQNMNIMFGFSETCGLEYTGLFP